MMPARATTRTTRWAKHTSFSASHILTLVLVLTRCPSLPQYCVWQITPEDPALWIEFNFLEFNLENFFDSVWLIQGDAGYGYIVHSLTGDLSTPFKRDIFGGDYAAVVFITDGSVTRVSEFYYCVCYSS